MVSMYMAVIYNYSKVCKITRTLETVDNNCQVNNLCRWGHQQFEVTRGYSFCGYRWKW